MGFGDIHYPYDMFDGNRFFSLDGDTGIVGIFQFLYDFTFQHGKGGNLGIEIVDEIFIDGYGYGFPVGKLVGTFG